MKTIRILSKLIAVAAVFAMVLSFASCFSGALKLESFTVDRSSVKTNYLVGEEVDFSGIKAVAKYSDPSLNKTYTYDELKRPSGSTLTYGSFLLINGFVIDIYKFNIIYMELL